MSEINCNDVINKICMDFDDKEKCKDMIEHIKACKTCEDYFSSIDKVVDTYKKYKIEITDDKKKELLEYLKLI